MVFSGGQVCFLVDTISARWFYLPCFLVTLNLHLQFINIWAGKIDFNSASTLEFLKGGQKLFLHFLVLFYLFSLFYDFYIA